MIRPGPWWALDYWFRTVGRRPMGAVGAFGVRVAVGGELQILVFDF